MIDEEVCEECKLYGTTGTDHCEKDCVRLAIEALEQEPSREFEDYENCKECRKDWTKCGTCSVMMQWLKDNKQEPCEDCISKKAVLDKINEICFSREQEAVDFRVAQGSNGQRDLIIDFIENLPSVQSKPKTGYWNTYEITQGGINEEWIECSECMWSNALVIPRNYCPNCGCKMEVIGDDNRRSN